MYLYFILILYAERSDETSMLMSRTQRKTVTIFYKFSFLQFWKLDGPIHILWKY